MECGFVKLGQSSCGHPEFDQDYRIGAMPGSAFSIGVYSTTTRTLAGSSPLVRLSRYPSKRAFISDILTW